MWSLNISTQNRAAYGPLSYTEGLALKKLCGLPLLTFKSGTQLNLSVDVSSRSIMCGISFRGGYRARKHTAVQAPLRRKRAVTYTTTSYINSSSTSDVSLVAMDGRQTAFLSGTACHCSSEHSDHGVLGWTHTGAAVQDTVRQIVCRRQ